eukprot:6521892-Pyramimonas_sp.AAC.1
MFCSLGPRGRGPNAVLAQALRYVCVTTAVLFRRGACFVFAAIIGSFAAPTPARTAQRSLSQAVASRAARERFPYASCGNRSNTSTQLCHT